MKFKVHFKDERHSWWEEFSVNRVTTQAGAEDSGRAMTSFYNTIRSREDQLPKTFVEAKLLYEPLLRCYAEVRDYSLEDLGSEAWLTGCPLCGGTCWLDIPAEEVAEIDKSLDKK